MYVYESGDTGLSNSPNTHFVLSGLVVHESKWRSFITRTSAFRKIAESTHGLPLRTAIHAAEYIESPPVEGMKRHVRSAILRDFPDEIAKMDFASITNVVIDKTNKPVTHDVFENTSKALFRRFENTMMSGSFPGGHKQEFGLVFMDDTDGRKLTKLTRKMSVYDAMTDNSGVGTTMMPIQRIIEDPRPRDSRNSYFIRGCDIRAYFLMREFRPNGYVRRSGTRDYFDWLTPVLNKHASRSDRSEVVIL